MSKNVEFKNEIPNKTKPLLSVMHPNTWTNEFGDFIACTGGFMDKKKFQSSYTITIEGKYIKSVGGLNLAKRVINEYRNTKSKWVGSRQ